MKSPVHILRLKNGDEFHCQCEPYDAYSLDSGVVALLYCAELNIVHQVGKEPTHYEMIQNHCYAIWECK